MAESSATALPDPAPLGAVRTEWIGSIRSVDREAWDALAVGCPFGLYGWIRAVEEAAGDALRSQHLLLFEGTSLVAAAVGRIEDAEGAGPEFERLAFGRLAPLVRRLGLRLSPAFVCGPPRGGYGAHLLVQASAGPERRRALRAALLDAIEAHARASRLRVCFPGVLGHESELVELLRARGYASTLTSPVNWMDSAWSDFDGYLAHVAARSRNAKGMIRWERNKNRRQGVTIRPLEDPERHAKQIHALIDANYRRHNGRPYPLGPHFFPAFHEQLGENGTLSAAWKDGELVGVVLVLRRDDVVCVNAVGVDHEKTGNDFTYFNLVYYQPVEDAIAQGVRHLYFSNSMYEAKMRRGCDTVDAFLFQRGGRLLQDWLIGVWFRLHSRWFRRKHAYTASFMEPREVSGGEPARGGRRPARGRQEP